MVFSDSKNTGWLEIAIDAAPEVHDPLSAFFFDLGATGVVLEDFGNQTLKAYLPLERSPEEIRDKIFTYLSQLSLILPNLPIPDFRLSKLENQDWQKNWRRFFRPVQVTPTLLILPVWENQPPQGEITVIRIDPGPAFGTGQHATTKMCLQAMESLGAQRGQTLLDVGTGSGILAIYGAKLGFERIMAIDVDPEAVRWAERNIRLNGAANAVSLSETPVQAINERFSLVCANLILGELLRLMQSLYQLVKSGGYLVISGILRDQVKQIEEALHATLFAATRTLNQDEWACMVLRKDGE
ncbi:MAG: 50S ribosomal protein L11 methyltransferase [Deltaproteobacteria bacterium]|nr:50S ribosomal protein L11 methyltransferase [Deltaproteobacteria bacterium]